MHGSFLRYVAFLFQAASKGPEQQQRLKRLQLAVHLDEIEVAINELQNQHADVRYCHGFNMKEELIFQGCYTTGVLLTTTVCCNAWSCNKFERLRQL